MDVVALQWDLKWEAKAANFSRVEELVARAAPRPGALVVLPEMFATGFSMNVGRTAEENRGETFAFLGSVARTFRVSMLGGVVTRGEGGRAYNEAVGIAPDGTETIRYRKMHPFTYAGEGEHFDAGEGGLLWRTEDLTVAPFVCYDLRFPEVFRLAARDGAELFVVIANWPSSRVEHWRLLLRARAVENQAYVVGVNRCGRDPNVAYPGASLAVDPQGGIVGELGEEEGWLGLEVDPERVRAIRREFPFLRDLRADQFRG